MFYPINSTPINGNQTLHGFGSAAMTLNASGFTAKQKTGVSTAALSEVLAVGAMKQARVGAGSGLIEVLAIGTIQKASPGPQSTADISVTANYGIPNPCIIPTEFAPTHRSRVIVVKKDGRVVDVYAESPFP